MSDENTMCTLLVGHLPVISAGDLTFLVCIMYVQLCLWVSFTSLVQGIGNGCLVVCQDTICFDCFVDICFFAA